MGLALGLVLLAAVLFFLWRSSGKRGLDHPRGTPPPAPLATARPAALEPAAAPRVGVEPARLEPETSARLTVAALVPEGVVLGPLQLYVEAETGRLRETTLEPGQRETSLELEPGAHTLWLLHAGTPVLRSLPLRIELPTGATRTAEVRLFACWICTGSVVDEGERGIEGLELSLERAGVALAGARTDTLGRFAFPPLPEGEFELVVGNPRGPLVPRRPVRLDEELRALEVRVPQLLELALRVVDGNGFPVAEADVEGTGEGGGLLEGTTDADGLLQARHLPPGKYRVFASRADVGRGTRSFVLAPGGETIEIQLLTARAEK